MEKNVWSSLNKKISVMVLIMVISSTAIVGLFSYYFYRRDFITANGHEACSIAQTVASAIDPAQFKETIETNIENEYWHKIKKFADNTKIRTEVIYLYILDSEYDKNVKYFLEGITPDEGEVAELGYEETVEVHADEMFETLKTGLPSTTEIYEAGEYGSMISGFAPIISDDGEVVGVVGVDISVEQALETSNIFGIMIIAWVIIFSTVFWLVFRQYIVRNVINPIAALSVASEKIAKGDMDIELSFNSRDEIGKLMASFKEMAHSTKKQIEVLENMANGDLTVDVSSRSQNDTMSFAIRKTIETLNNTIDATTKAAQTLVNGVTDQTAAVTQLETSITKVADKTKESSVMAGEAATLANTVKDKAEKGSAQMDRMTQAVNEINEANHSIKKIIKTIDDIAFQTNILALNAAVEAAHAGQYGKGFAVVADEVRGLANKSAEAAKDTNVLISNSIEKSSLGVHIADETAVFLNEIVSEINESTEIMGKVAGSSEEQSADIMNINTDLSQVVRVIQQNNVTAEQLNYHLMSGFKLKKK